MGESGVCVMAIDRRRFLQQSASFNAWVAPGSLSAIVAAVWLDSEAAIPLMVGHWGADGDHSAQSEVAAGMHQCVQRHWVTSVPTAIFDLPRSLGRLLG
jgi:hypothetical protein